MLRTRTVTLGVLLGWAAGIATACLWARGGATVRACVSRADAAIRLVHDDPCASDERPVTLAVIGR
ncbi:MAG: hypothetical protein U0807_11830 [Candidatus Binatia bacterium]